MDFNPCPSPASSSESEADRRKRARLRRSEATSSDSSDAGQFSIFNVPLRVAAPPPHPFPVRNEWDDQCTEINEIIGEQVLADGAREILSAQKVDGVVLVDLTSRVPQRSGATLEGQPTIFIVARWIDDGCSVIWERAVSKIKKFVDSKRLESKNPELDIAVEIVAEEHTLAKYLAPVSAELLSHGFETDWPVISDKVSSILEACPYTMGHVTAINMIRRGTSTNHDDNPNTVFITVDYLCEETKWAPVVREIQQYLRQPRFQYANLFVHMEHGVVEHCVGFHLV
ncbi:hypothetical protein B0T16DRAFT_314441, partial [Cercophora newfieldiana]